MRTLINFAESIGAALVGAVHFDRVYAAERIEDAVRADLDAVVATAVAPLDWAADQAPAQDFYSIRRLQEVMATCRISSVTLISSCAVYPVPRGVNEYDHINPCLLTPYGRHRYHLERWCRDHWDTTVVRLPHVFGGPHRSDIRNPAVDLASLAALNPGSTKQHYDLARLADDLAMVKRLGLKLVNLVPPPLTNRRVLSDLLGLAPMPGAELVRQVLRDVRSAHAGAFGGADGYIETEAEVLDRIAAYVLAG
ncbi:MAG: NAD-dependent epimerase/dehydratase family protein [Bifidobacteriaceae bacterium]|nr:NAD-dependent epimerase/dehydratase family protein [Bifidobacteriaceae bacterium]